MSDRWSAAEDRLLRKLAPKCTSAQISSAMGNRTAIAVQLRASRLKIKLLRGFRYYTNTELARMRELAATHTAAEAAHLLNRPLSGLRQRALKAGIKFRTDDGIGRQATGKVSRGLKNRRAKPYSLVSPDGTHYRGRNVNHFVREHAHLFDKRDLIWKNLTCNAAIKLNRLRPGTSHSLRRWKGWSWDPKSQRADGRGHWPAGRSQSTLTAPERRAVIRRIRTAVALQSIRAVARTLGIDDRSVRRILNGTHQPSERIRTLAEEKL